MIDSRLHLRFAALGCVLSIVATAQVPAPAPAFDTTTLWAHASLPAGKVHDSVLFEATAGSEVKFSCACGGHLTWVEQLKGKQTVRSDGKQIGDGYDEVAHVLLSADGQHIVFTAKQGGKWSLFVDGVERTRRYGRMTAPTVSGFPAPVAVGACDGKKCHLVIDTTEIGPEFKDVSAPEYGLDHAHLFYMGWSDKGGVVVRDGKEEGPVVQGAWSWIINPDGEHVAVAAQMGDEWTWIIDGLPASSEFDVIGWLAYSRDGKRTAFAAVGAQNTGFLDLGKHQTHGSLVLDGKIAQNFDGSGFGGGLSEALGARTQIVKGLHRLTPDFAGVGDPRFTSDGKLILYAARRGAGDAVVFVDSVAGPGFDDIVSPVAITRDGKHLFYVARKGATFIEVHDQQPGRSVTPEKRDYLGVGAMFITENDEHFAYEVVRGGAGYKAGRSHRAQRRVVVDGRVGAEYDAYGISEIWVSSDGRHFAYLVVGADEERDRAVVDGLEGSVYDWIFPESFKAIDDQHIEYEARAGNRFVRVTVSME